MHMLARVCLFRIGLQAARDKPSKSTQLISSGASWQTVLLGKVTGTLRRFENHAGWCVSPGGNACAMVAPHDSEQTRANRYQPVWFRPASLAR